MFINYWLDRSQAVIEEEVILVKASANSKYWFKIMDSILPVIHPEMKPLKNEDFAPMVGVAHHLRLTKFGIEGVLQAPRKCHRLDYYVIYDKANQPDKPFWVVLFKHKKEI